MTAYGPAYTRAQHPTGYGSPARAGSALPGMGRQAYAIRNYALEGVSGAIRNRPSVVTRAVATLGRPVLTCNPNLSIDDRRLYAAIDTSCFELALPGSTGMDSIQRPIRGPGLNKWDEPSSGFRWANGESRYVQR